MQSGQHALLLKLLLHGAYQALAVQVGVAGKMGAGVKRCTLSGLPWKMTATTCIFIASCSNLSVDLGGRRKLTAKNNDANLSSESHGAQACCARNIADNIIVLLVGLLLQVVLEPLPFLIGNALMRVAVAASCLNGRLQVATRSAPAKAFLATCYGDAIELRVGAKNVRNPSFRANVLFRYARGALTLSVLLRRGMHGRTHTSQRAQCRINGLTRARAYVVNVAHEAMRSHQVARVGQLLRRFICVRQPPGDYGDGLVSHTGNTLLGIDGIGIRVGGLAAWLLCNQAVQSRCTETITGQENMAADSALALGYRADGKDHIIIETSRATSGS
eukprot:6202682-Pleurochrysis_carterae.AAC.3